MKSFPIPENEKSRLKALKNYEILNSLSEQEYDRITKLASIICDVPISLITFLDEERQWFKSKVGLDINQTSRELAFCQYTIMDSVLFEVEDALVDDRFADNLLVTKDPNIRFYAGYPLTDPNGFTLGTLCVIDRKPNKLNSGQKEALRLLSLEVMDLIVQRRLKEELRSFEKLFLFSNDLICVSGTDGSFRKVNPTFQKILGWTANEMLEKNIMDLVHPMDYQSTMAELEKLKEGESVLNFEHRLRTADDHFKIFQWVVSPEVNTDNVFAIGRDVTDLKNSEETLAAKEADLKAIFENSQGFITTHDIEGSFISINSSGAKMLGYTIDELLQMNLFDVIPQERHSGVHAYLQQIAENGHSSGEMIVTDKEGNQKILMFNNVLKRKPDNSIYVIGNALDITQSKQMAARLSQLTEMLEQTNQVARVGGWQLDLETRHLYWTAITREIHELPLEIEPTLESGIDFYKEGVDRDKIVLAFNEAVATGKSWDLELQVITYKGKQLWVKSKGNPIFENGVCKRLYGSFQDIDEQKKNEIEVFRSKAILRSFVTHTPAAVAMLDKNMHYIAVSNRWIEEYQLAGKDIIGKSYYDFFPFISEEGRKRHQRILAGAVERKEEDIYLGTDGNGEQYITWEMRPWLQSDGIIEGMMIFTQNITAAVRQRKELDNAKLAAEQASVAKSDFLSSMSHEIRTPLNGVIGFTDLVLKTQLNDTQSQYLNIVNQSATALLGIINDILDFSKIEAGKLELDLEHCDIYDICGQSVDIITFHAQKKDLEMLLNISHDLPRFVWTDSIRIKQILVNLMGNATKFTENGEIELKAEVLEHKDEMCLIQFSVRDTGIGIMPNKIDKIFEAFGQEDASTTKKYGGTGLGLTITNKLLALMDSKLQLKSVVGEGSTFYFNLWLKCEHGEARQWENLNWIKTALIVDDNPNNRIIVEDMLKLKDIKTTSAKNGFECLQLLATGEKYDTIIMDYHMPYLDGIDTIRQIRNTFEKSGVLVPIVLLFSSADDERVIRACEELHVNARLTKPVKMAELYDMLSRLLVKENFKTILPPAAFPGLTAKAITILIADDNPINLLLAKTIINRAAVNAIVIEALNGIEALESFKQHQPDLILMDVQMPEMNGYEATIAIRDLERYDQHTPIIALTAGNIKNERERCSEAGMDDFVVKPVIEDTVIQILKKWLETEEEELSFSIELTEELSHFDPGVLKLHVGDDVAVISEILALTKVQLEISLHLLHTSFILKDLTDFTAEGHKIYGTAVSAGLPKIAMMARQIEMVYDMEDNATADLYKAIKDEIMICHNLL